MFERSTEEHNGWPNYETWVFWLHITNTQSLLRAAVYFARPLVEMDYHPAVVGDVVIRHFKEWCWNEIESFQSEQYRDALLMAQDVGSFWRIDDVEIGRHVIDYVKESS